MRATAPLDSSDDGDDDSCRRATTRIAGDDDDRKQSCEEEDDGDAIIRQLESTADSEQAEGGRERCRLWVRLAVAIGARPNSGKRAGAAIGLQSENKRGKYICP